MRHRRRRRRWSPSGRARSTPRLRTAMSPACTARPASGQPPANSATHSTSKTAISSGSKSTRAVACDKGVFVAQVVGGSMEPAIPDGAWCLFRAPVAGTRQGKTVLVQLRDATDPETGQRYTVKRYKSEKVTGRRLLAPREDHPRAHQPGLRADCAHRRGRGRTSGNRRAGRSAGRLRHGPGTARTAPGVAPRGVRPRSGLEEDCVIHPLPQLVLRHACARSR